MDTKWFKDDRALAHKDKTVSEKELIAESKKALQNSTLFQRRLDQILDDLIEASVRDDEDFSKPGWQHQAIANISRRKVLGEIKRLIKL